MPKKVVLAYSGGLDTSIIIPWLKETYGCEVIAMIGDVGQQEDLEARAEERRWRRARLRVTSKTCAKSSSPTTSGRRCAPARCTNTNICWALPWRGRCSPSARRKSRSQLGADAVAHGCTGKGNDQVRFELAYKAIAPELTDHRAVARVEHQLARGRHRLCARAQRAGGADQSNIYSRDRNIWHLSHEGGVLEDPANAPDEAMWQWIASPEKAPDKPTKVEIGFEGGTPVSVNGKKLGPRGAARRAERHRGGERRGTHRPGRKSAGGHQVARRVRNAGRHAAGAGASRTRSAVPGSRDAALRADALALRYAELVYYGLWFTPLREALDAFLHASAAARDRHGGAEAVQGQRQRDARGARPIRSTARISPASP